MTWILSGIGNVPTPTFWHWLCANSECALDCMELYRILHDIHALLACWLKIILPLVLSS
jgi:hypothetical protein